MLIVVCMLFDASHRLCPSLSICAIDIRSLIEICDELSAVDVVAVIHLLISIVVSVWRRITTTKSPIRSILGCEACVSVHDAGNFFRVIEIDWHNLVDTSNGQMANAMRWHGMMVMVTVMDWWWWLICVWHGNIVLYRFTPRTVCS